MSHWRRIGYVAASALALVTLAAGQARINPAAWSGRLEPGEVRPGAQAKLLLTAKLDLTTVLRWWLEFTGEIVHRIGQLF